MSNQILLSVEESNLYERYRSENHRSPLEEVEKIIDQYKHEINSLSRKENALYKEVKEHIPNLIVSILELARLKDCKAILDETKRCDISLNDDEKILKLIEEVLNEKIKETKKYTENHYKVKAVEEAKAKSIDDRQPYYKELWKWVEDKWR